MGAVTASPARSWSGSWNTGSMMERTSSSTLRELSAIPTNGAALGLVRATMPQPRAKA